MTKEEIREQVWSLLETQNVARFPGARGRIPNFTGAEQCAEGIARLGVWKRAKVIKANPDSPQRAIRHLALKQGKIIYMAVPRLREQKCFVELDPKCLGKNIYLASSIKGAFEFGRQVAIEKMRSVDVILCGSVAVRRDGARVGKGGGYSDLEFAIALEKGIINNKTQIITTVHPLQIVTAKIEVEPHDIPVDFIITPEKIVECDSSYPKPTGIYWQYLDQETIDAIPVLRKMRNRLAFSASGAGVQL